MILLNINSHAKESTKLVLQDLLSIKAPATVCLIEDSPCCLTGLRKPVTHTGLTRPTPGESLSLPLVWPGLLREKICHSHRFDPAYSWRKPVTSTGLTQPTPGESLSLTLVWPGLLREKACHFHWFDPAYSGRKPVTHTGLIRPSPGESLSITLRPYPYPSSTNFRFLKPANRRFIKPPFCGRRTPYVADN